MTELIGHVLGIFLQPAQRTRPQPVSAARALLEHGLEGDVHGKKRPGDRRQILIVDAAILRQFGLKPGDLREQIDVDFSPLEGLPAGTPLQIGGVTFELTGPCEPCTHIGKTLGVDDTVRFQQALQGCRGQLARVVAVSGEGLIRVGDQVLALHGTPAARS